MWYLTATTSFFLRVDPHCLISQYSSSVTILYPNIFPPIEFDVYRPRRLFFIEEDSMKTFSVVHGAPRSSKIGCAPIPWPPTPGHATFRFRNDAHEARSVSTPVTGVNFGRCARSRAHLSGLEPEPPELLTLGRSTCELQVREECPTGLPRVDSMPSKGPPRRAGLTVKRSRGQCSEAGGACQAPVAESRRIERRGVTHPRFSKPVELHCSVLSVAEQVRFERTTGV